MLTRMLDNDWPRDPVGIHKEPFNFIEPPCSPVLSADAYGFVNLGLGFRGLPIWRALRISGTSSLSLKAGRMLARNRSGQRFVAKHVIVGFDDRFSTPGW